MFTEKDAAGLSVRLDEMSQQIAELEDAVAALQTRLDGTVEIRHQWEGGRVVKSVIVRPPTADRVTE